MKAITREKKTTNVCRFLNVKNYLDFENERLFYVNFGYFKDIY